MKKPIPVFLLLFTILQGCENYKSQYELANQKIDSLIYVSDIKDSSLNSFMTSFNEIESNLDTITNKQTTIEQNAANAEVKGDQKERINNDILIINDFLERNKVLIAELQQKVKSQGGRISQMKKMIETLTKQVAEKDTELVALKFQLDDLKMNVENLNVTIDTLSAQNLEKGNEIKAKTDTLHTAYYVIGTYKELRDKNVVNKEGGFLGIGKNQMLKHDFNNDAFTKIDVTQLITIPLDCKSAKVLTVHPSKSYTLDKDKDKVNSLTITDYQNFWGVSKYLVIIKD